MDEFGDHGTHETGVPEGTVTARLSRRRTMLVAGVGALAVVLALGGPILAFGGPEPGDDVQPTPRSPQTGSQRDLVTAVPGGFPIDAGPGFEDGSWTPLEDTVALYVCGEDAWVQPVDSLGATIYGGETNEERELAVYPDDETASAALTGIGTGVAECPPQDVGQGEFAEPQPMGSSLGDESVAYLDQYGDGDGPNGEGLAVVVTRVGNALLMHRSYLIGGADDLAVGQENVDRIVEDAAPVVEAMCVFSAEGCPDRPEATGTDIPDGFDLGIGLVSGGDDQVAGPSRTIDGVDLAALCAVPGWPGGAATDRLAARATGPEYEEVRELLTFTDAEAAKAAMGLVQQGFEGCRPPADTAVEPLTGDAGYESSLTYALTYDEGLGGTIVQLVRAGRAVLVVSSAGELLRETVQISADAFTERNRTVSALLCPWTEAAC